MMTQSTQGVQNDLNDEMWQDAGYSSNKRKTKSAELGLYQEHQKSKQIEAQADSDIQNATCDNENAACNNSDNNDDDDDDDHAVVVVEEERARRLAETQARQRSIRSKRIVMSDSESEG